MNQTKNLSVCAPIYISFGIKDMKQAAEAKTQKSSIRVMN